ncbi:MAG: deaminase [Myxococcota bacterium]
MAAAISSAHPLAMQQLRSADDGGVSAAPVELPQHGPRVAQKPDDATPARSAVVAERHELFMLAAMAYMAVEWKERPEIGGPIAAIVAWNVSDITRTPRFVIDRNRSRSRENGTYHAEISAIHKAYQAKPKGVRWKGWLANTTLYATLEPCLMCAATMPVQHIPRAEYCMEDPSIRAAEKPDRPRKHPVPTEYHGRKFAMQPSSLGRCARLNATIWRRVDGARKNGSREFRFFTYLRNNVDTLFGPSVRALASRKATYRQNAELLQNLRTAVRSGGD